MKVQQKLVLACLISHQDQWVRRQGNIKTINIVSRKGHKTPFFHSHLVNTICALV